MKKFIITMLLCMGMLLPQQVSAYEGTMESTGATDVTYISSDIVITAPIEAVVIPPKTDDTHEMTGYLLAISVSLLIFLLIIYNREREDEETEHTHV